MQYGKVTGIDKPVARLVQGTMMLSSKALDRGFQLLDGVFEQGGNTFDAAHVYSSGDCERVLGRWIKDRGLRDKVFIIDKGAHPNDDRNRVTPFDIASDLHDSLARLQTDRIDLYLLHRDDPSVELGPIVETLNAHLRDGRILAFGASNWSASRIAAANDYAAKHGLVPFVASSPNFSLAVPREMPWEGCVSICGPAGKTDRGWYAMNRMPVFAWSSLAGGFFSGRFRRDNLAAATGYFDQLVVRCYGSENNFRRLDWAEKMARERGLSIPQVALAWVFAQGLNVHPLVGCQTPEEFAANAQALAVTDLGSGPV